MSNAVHKQEESVCRKTLETRRSKDTCGVKVECCQCSTLSQSSHHFQRFVFIPSKLQHNTQQAQKWFLIFKVILMPAVGCRRRDAFQSVCSQGSCVHLLITCPLALPLSICISNDMDRFLLDLTFKKCSFHYSKLIK